MKKEAEKLKQLISEFGYWSEEVKQFNDSLIAKYGHPKYILISNKAMLH